MFVLFQKKENYVNFSSCKIRIQLRSVVVLSVFGWTKNYIDGVRGNHFNGSLILTKCNYISRKYRRNLIYSVCFRSSLIYLTKILFYTRVRSGFRINRWQKHALDKSALTVQQYYKLFLGKFGCLTPARWKINIYRQLIGSLIVYLIITHITQPEFSIWPSHRKIRVGCKQEMGTIPVSFVLAVNGSWKYLLWFYVSMDIWHAPPQFMTLWVTYSNFITFPSF